MQELPNIDRDEFIKHVASIFEENCLPLIDDVSQIEQTLNIASNYCLDHLKIVEN